MIYLDNAATTKPHQEVIDMYEKLSKTHFVNKDAPYGLAYNLLDMYEQSKKRIISLMNLKNRQVIYTSGASEANNLAIKGIAFKYINQNKELITSTIEHPSVLNTFKQLEKIFGFKVTYIHVDSKGQLDMNQLKQSINKNTILVSLMAVNNELGFKLPIETVSELLKKHPHITFHVDAVQSFAKIDMNYQDIDLITLSQHKMNGLKGSGALIKKEGILLEEVISGGAQEYGFRAGTVDHNAHMMFAKTMRLSMEADQENRDRIKKLKQNTIKQLSTIENIEILPFQESSDYILGFSCIGYKAEVIINDLARKEIYVSTRSSCSSKKKSVSHVIEAIGCPDTYAEGALRMSFSYHTTDEEVSDFIHALKDTLHHIERSH